MNQDKSLIVDEMTDRLNTAESKLSIQKREMDDLIRKHQAELKIADARKNNADSEAAVPKNRQRQK